MRAFMSAICSRTCASESWVGTSELCSELGSGELGGETGGESAERIFGAIAADERTNMTTSSGKNR
jgi:hypothetical protein